MARDDAVVPQDPAVVCTEAWGLVKTLGPQEAGGVGQGECWNDIRRGPPESAPKCTVRFAYTCVG